MSKRDTVIDTVLQLVPVLEQEFSDSRAVVGASADQALSALSFLRPGFSVALIDVVTETREVELPPAFSSRVSTIAFVQTSDETDVDWERVEPRPTGPVLVLKSPFKGTLRVGFTTGWTWDNVPDALLWPLTYGTLWHITQALAIQYGTSFRSQIDSSTINYRTKADAFRDLAKTYERQFRESLGVPKDKPVPFSWYLEPQEESQAERANQQR